MKTMMTLLLLAAADQEVDRRLDVKISVDFRGEKLSRAVEVIREATGLNFVVAEGGETPVSLTVRDLRAKSALRLLLQPAGLGATLENGAVVIRAKSSLAAPVMLRIYDVRGMLAKLQDFPGARIELAGLVRSGLF